VKTLSFLFRYVLLALSRGDARTIMGDYPPTLRLLRRSRCSDASRRRAWPHRCEGAMARGAASGRSMKVRWRRREHRQEVRVGHRQERRRSPCSRDRRALPISLASRVRPRAWGHARTGLMQGKRFLGAAAALLMLCLRRRPSPSRRPWRS